ncbi:MAG: D-alanyl-D-alanine carboxypeptidase [Fusobacteriaceae bacterium]|jgi:D-alanyl-D-alanine carboxypeptidase (penicillin-binding protein 5/6)|nr:D-alanyl-D-alanine carboxypeptidase [Fusobacteriaceae bacterium]
MKKFIALILILFNFMILEINGAQPKPAVVAKKTVKKIAKNTKRISTSDKNKKEVPVKIPIVPIPDEDKMSDDTESGETGVEETLEKADKLYFAVLLGDENGNIYYSENINTKWPLASITKMMTLLVMYDELKKGNIKLNDEVTIPKAAMNVEGSKIPLKEGEIFILEDLIKAAGIYSANNATYAIAHYVGGNIENFVKMMNNKALELGLSGELEFHTPAGLPTHMTKKPMDMGTANGIYKLSMEFSKIDKLMEIASIEKINIHNNKIALRNRNKLIGRYGIYGIKTGYHSKAGYNISLVSDKDGLKIITVVFGGKSYRGRDEIAMTYLDSFYSNFNFKEIINENLALVKVPVLHGAKEYIELYPDKNYKKMINIKDGVNIKIKRNTRVIAPVKKGEVLGSYEIYVKDQKVLEGELKSTENIKLKLGF